MRGLNTHLYLSMYMARLVTSSGHQEDTRYNEIGLCHKNMLAAQ